MGGHVGMLLDHDGLPETPRLVEFQSFDAFGVPLTKRLPSSPTYAWRGGGGDNWRAGRSNKLCAGAQRTGPGTFVFQRMDTRCAWAHTATDSGCWSRPEDHAAAPP